MNDLYNGALEDLWRSWHRLAAPIVAGALRLALPMPLDDADLDMAEQLADIADSSGGDLPGRLLTLVLARADERPLRHATRLDADTAWATVASEVTRVVTGSHHGSHGVS